MNFNLTLDLRNLHIKKEIKIVKTMLVRCIDDIFEKKKKKEPSRTFSFFLCCDPKVIGTS